MNILAIYSFNIFFEEILILKLVLFLRAVRKLQYETFGYCLKWFLVTVFCFLCFNKSEVMKCITEVQIVD